MLACRLNINALSNHSCPFALKGAAPSVTQYSVGLDSGVNGNDTVYSTSIHFVELLCILVLDVKVNVIFVTLEIGQLSVFAIQQGRGPQSWE